MNQLMKAVSDPVNAGASALGMGANGAIAATNAASDGPLWLTIFSVVMATITPVLGTVVVRWINTLSDEHKAKLAAIAEAAEVARVLAEAALVAANERLAEMQRQVDANRDRLDSTKAALKDQGIQSGTDIDVAKLAADGRVGSLPAG